ncbi:MAG: ATP-dependent DNA helicase RecG [Candidatus Cloacimonetes bacterium]|nr:ATP-dependent DNA helicase RecG [Candidatus Cloacimonadota bacterium]
MEYMPRDTEVKFLKGVGDFRAKLFENMGILAVNDLLEYFPRDYLLHQTDAQIRHLKVGQFVSMKLQVYNVQEVTTKSGKKQLKAIVTDREHRQLECMWFRYGKWVTKLLSPGNTIRVTGHVSEYNGNLQLAHPQIEEEKEELNHDFWADRSVLPLYALTTGLTQNIVRNAVYAAFALFHQNIDETLPADIIEKYHFLDRKTALQKMHFTLQPEYIQRVKARFVYEEFFYLQIMIARNTRDKADVIKQKRHFYSHQNQLVETLKQKLPFTLTNAQKKVINEIYTDMVSEKPMSRLLQGDVGAGKTIVTLFAIFLAIENGYQTALIAPTEILAEQHFHTISQLTKDIEGVNICLIKGGVSKQKKADKQAIAEGNINIAIGTHALFQKDVVFARLSLIVIDEQHRFGVAQRSQLSTRHGFPDLLYLSATPIPRSLAMTVFGDMTISSINELPPTRKPVKTQLVYGNQKSKIYTHLREELEKGRQIYFVCPLIEESEKIELQDAESLYKEIQETLFPSFPSAILHGQMKAKEKDEIMASFVSGQTKILVSTTVIEVGIDVPNASVMVIEHAERFGLAQLHQLRGRVGRGADQAYCYLIAYAMSEIGKERLRTMTTTNDGFIIAEKDLELRGPGDMFGTAQSGLPEFKFANLITDQGWLNTARQDAFLLIEDDPELAKPENDFTKKYYDSYVLKKEAIVKF